MKLTESQISIMRKVYANADEQTKTELIQQFGKEIKESKLPKRWDELESIGGYWIDQLAKIKEYGGMNAFIHNQNVFATEKQAKSALAYAQLTQLMKAYNGDWVADWDDVEESKFCIYSEGYGLVKTINKCIFQFIHFKNAELRDHFMEHHEGLIKQFFMID